MGEATYGIEGGARRHSVAAIVFLVLATLFMFQVANGAAITRERAEQRRNFEQMRQWRDAARAERVRQAALARHDGMPRDQIAWDAVSTSGDARAARPER